MLISNEPLLTMRILSHRVLSDNLVGLASAHTDVDSAAKVLLADLAAGQVVVAHFSIGSGIFYSLDSGGNTFRRSDCERMVTAYIASLRSFAWLMRNSSGMTA